MNDISHPKSDLLISSPADRSTIFGITKQQLIEIASSCQERTFSEDVDLIESMGGDLFLERALVTNFKTGLKGDDFDIRI